MPERGYLIKMCDLTILSKSNCLARVLFEIVLLSLQGYRGEMNRSARNGIKRNGNE